MSDLLTQAQSLVDAGLDEQTAWTQLLTGTETASTPEVCEALAYVLTRLQDEKETVSGGFAAVVVEATFDVDGLNPDLEDFVDPARLRYLRYNLAQRLVEHEGLSSEATLEIIVRTLKWVFVRRVKSSSIEDLKADLKHMVWMLSRTDQVDVSLLGTVWRFFANLPAYAGYLNTAMNWMRFNRNCPLPVILDFYIFNDNVIPLEQENLFGRMVEVYPDLEDLPRQMVAEVVATQPLPSEWFTDRFPLPAGSTLLAPSSLVSA